MHYATGADSAECCAFTSSASVTIVFRPISFPVRVPAGGDAGVAGILQRTTRHSDMML